jgi:predicted RNA-binding Zn-ribbon protein involved in translation (DUF1610 family)
MFAALGLKLINSLRRFAVPVKCPKCGHQFKPGADREFASWTEFLGRFPCPKCGFRFGIGEDSKSRKSNPPGPFEKPNDSTVEEQQVSGDALLFILPRSGHWGGMLPITIIWNLGMVPGFVWMVALGKWPALGPQIFITVFFVVGLALIYFALSLRFARHLLYLGPEIVCMQRALLLRKNHDLPTAAIESVWRVEAYSHVTGGGDTGGLEVKHVTYCIELRAGFKAVRFGSTLTPGEQHWLAWRIREYVRQHGGTQLGEELPKSVRPAELEPDEDSE